MPFDLLLCSQNKLLLGRLSQEAFTPARPSAFWFSFHTSARQHSPAPRRTSPCSGIWLCQPSSCTGCALAASPWPGLHLCKAQGTLKDCTWEKLVCKSSWVLRKWKLNVVTLVRDRISAATGYQGHSFQIFLLGVSRDTRCLPFPTSEQPRIHKKKHKTHSCSAVQWESRSQSQVSKKGRFKSNTD